MGEPSSADDERSGSPVAPPPPGEPARGPGLIPLHVWEYATVSGELGRAAGQSLVLTLLPVLIERHATSAFWIGFAVGGEGVFAILLPYWVGTASDWLPSSLAHRFGRRGFFLLLSAPVMALALTVLPFFHSYWLLAGCAFVFYAGLQSVMTPLSALMIDSVPDERRARVQGVNGMLRSAGLAYGIVGGGLLYSYHPEAPFAVCAVLVLVSIGTSWLAGWRIGKDRTTPPASGRFSLTGDWRALERNRPALWFVAANGLWNAGIDGMRPFFLIFGLLVLGITIAQTSLLAIVLVVGLAVGSLVIGRLGDRYDRGRLLQAGALVAGLALGSATFVRHIYGAIAVMVFAGIGASAFIALSYPYFAGLTGGRHIGEFTGLYSVTVGLGRFLAPQLVGLAIDAGRPVYPQYQGYPFMWSVSGLFALLGLLAMRRSARSRPAAAKG